MRGADVSRATRVMSNEDFHASRPTPTAQTAKPDALIGLVMPQSSLMVSFILALGPNQFILMELLM